jgi:hypothetical protein
MQLEVLAQLSLSYLQLFAFQNYSLNFHFEVIVVPLAFSGITPSNSKSPI